MNEIKKELIDIILSDYSRFDLGLFIPVVSFLRDYSKVFKDESLFSKTNKSNFYSNNPQESFLLKRNQDRKNINKQTRKANDFSIKEDYHEKRGKTKRENERGLKGGFYCSYFSDLENPKNHRYR
jgi:hypothetical protein